MRARKSKLIHPSGSTLDTPLLIPSFSSKGFSVDKDGISETATALKITSESIYESMLISAYDIHYGYIPLGEISGAFPQITFVDSGGYETSDSFDLSTTFKHPI